MNLDGSPSQHSSVPSHSSENFQKFVYDLFEKNGILNNLRAHLRSHIINVLKSATNGNESISTPINFKKHLEPNNQALNILFAEYLLKMELNYSLSVFVSEIPLANMPFGFAKLLMQRPDEEMATHKLKEDDIISVLNCLGIHCDSDLICQVMGAYKNTDTSLLQCILQSLTFVNKRNSNVDDIHPSNLMSHSSSSIKSSDFEKNNQNYRSLSPSCKHIRKCAVCEGKITKLKEKYSNKVRHYKKNSTTNNTRDAKKHNLSNIDVLEKRLIDEMFQEVRSVYEGELQMLKASEERRIHASVASHAIALKKRIAQLEDEYQQKETQLQNDVRDKKELLRNLMDSIQQEHQLLINTIRDINQEAQKLAEKEKKMKTQIQDAEQFIKQRSQGMTNQIQCELEILITHLRSLKEEKQLIAKEKTELENLKKYCERNPENRVNVLDCKDPDHKLITSQLKKLKYVLDSLGVTKNVTERSTITELKDVTSKLNVMLNNEQELVDDRPNSFKITPNKLFNRLRKDKNINFCVSDPEEGRRDLCTSSSYRNIREENENLRAIAAQQSARIQELSNEVARAQYSLQPSNMLRATVFQPFNVQLQRLSAMPGFSNPTGGGEELKAFRGRPVSAPAVAVPFISSQQDAHYSRQRASSHTCKPSSSRRGQTHDKVLQEARRTLRKLEIEAEAVHSSYVEFQRKRDMRLDTESRENLGLKSPLNTVSSASRREAIVMAGTTRISHQEKLFKNLTENVGLVNPIPEEYGALKPPRERTRNHVDTPLTEFRKLYHCTEYHNNQEKLEPSNRRGIYINDEVVSITNLDIPEERNVASKSKESKKSYNTTEVTDVYTCKIINDFQNKCAEICFDLPMRDIATSETDERPGMLKVDIENITNSAVMEVQSKKSYVLEIQNSVDNNAVELVTANITNNAMVVGQSKKAVVSEIQNSVENNAVDLVTAKPSDTELRLEPNISAEIVSPIKGNIKQNNTKNSPTNASSKSDFEITNLIKINDKIENLKIENEDYQNDEFEESSKDENVSLKIDQENEKTRLNTINEVDKSDRMLELNTTIDLEIDEEGDEYQDDFTDLVASDDDSPKSIAKQYTDTDNENFWQP